ncbi:MAG: LamG-like jellyroll fold domain-containing protein, partial [bacterium]
MKGYGKRLATGLLALSFLLFITAGHSYAGPGKALNFSSSTYADTYWLGNNGYVINVAGDQLTVEFWFKGTNLTGAFTLIYSSTSPMIQVIAWSGHPGQYYYQFRKTDGIITWREYINRNVSDNTWHHLALTWQKSGTVTYFKSYVDGDLVGQSTQNNWTSIPANLKLNLSPEGLLDEFRIWNVARSQAEIQAAMSKTMAGNEANLRVYYNFDSMNGNDLPDMGPNHYTLYVANNPGLVTSDAPLDVPSVTTAPVTSVSSGSAESGGEVVDDCGETVTARGLCWNTTGSPTLANSFTSEGGGTGSFVSTVSGLTGGTTYYVRAYATNANGTGYGNQVSFTTKIPPVLTTATVSSIGDTSASCGGNITNDNGYPISARGVCWNTSGNPTTLDSHTEDGEGAGSFTSLITGLVPNTHYYVRAYATNSEGTGYGNEVNFISRMSPPGNALNFDGIDDLASTGNYSALNFSGTLPFTVEAWVRPAADHETGIIVSNYRNNIGGHYQLSLSEGKLVFFRRVAPWQVTGTTLLEKNTWYHLAGTYDGSTMRIYVNGVEEGSIISGSVPTYNFEVVIGAEFGPGLAYNHFQGAIDEVRIWNLARTESEIRSALYSPLTGNESGLVAYYNFDQTSGTYLKDLTSPYYDGWISSGPVWVASGAFHVPMLTTVDASSITETFAASGGILADEGGFPITEKGVCWNIAGNPTMYENKATEEGFDPQTGEYTCKVKGLTPGETYYLRAYALTSSGLGYGNEVPFRTLMAPPGNALTFDGNNRVLASVNIPSGDEISLEYWFKGSNLGCIPFIHNPATGLSIFSLTDLNQGVSFHGLANDGGWDNGLPIDDRGGSLVNDGRWHHVAMTWKRGTPDGFRSFLDGSLVAQRDSSNTPIPGAIGAELCLGHIFFNYRTMGQIDEFRIWNTARTRDQIREYMYKPIDSQGADHGDLLVYYDFDHISGAQLHDMGPHGFHGTLENDPIWATSSVPIGAPLVTTLDAPSKVWTTVPLGGNVTDENASPVTGRGMCWNTLSYPTIEDHLVQDTEAGHGEFTVTMEDLTPGATYYIRAYARNEAGVGYGEQVKFTTSMSPPGNALQLDGADDSVTIPHSPSLNFGTGAFTLEAWIRNTNTPGSPWKRIMTKRGSATSWYSLTLQENKLTLELATSSPSSYLAVKLGPEIQGDGLWHHVAATRDESGNIFLYVDGVRYSGGSFSGNLDNSAMLEIGRFGAEAYNGETFRGAIDEVRIWNTALSEEDLQSKMHTCLSGDESGLVAYYRFDYATGTILEDLTSHHNHGTLINGPVWTASGVILGVQNIWVDDDYTEYGDNDGHTWGWEAFDSIKDAVKTVLDGGTIVVKDGLYKGAKNRDIAFSQKQIALKSEHGSEKTIVDCEHEGFFLMMVLAGSTSIEGFTVINARNEAGSIFIAASSPDITDCMFIHNSASYGAGISNLGGSPTISRCMFLNNTAKVDGGGMYHRGNTQTLLYDCLFSGNTAGNKGGGICHSPTDPSAVMTTIMISCTFMNNTASNGGDGIFNEAEAGQSQSSEIVITNSILWGSAHQISNNGSGQVSITYSDIQGGYSGEGNIDADPQFALGDDPHLTAGSPCIDAGDPSFIAEPNETDLDGKSRVLDGDNDGIPVVDMGAYEFACTYIGDFDGQCDVDMADYAIFALAWLT